MKVTINNLLAEGLIDDIPSLTKMDKAVLKFLHQNKKETSENWGDADAHQVWDLMQTFGLNDGDYIFKMWKIYKNYGNILFDDISTIGYYTAKDYDKAADVIMMNYYEKNVVGKMVYPGWAVEMLDDMETMLAEDMITMEIRHINYPPTIFADIELSELSRRHEVHFDLMSMDEDNLGQYMYDHISKVPARDTLAMLQVMVPPPQNLSDEALKVYFNEILEEAHELIEEYDEKINEYYNENRPDGGWPWEQ